MPSITPNLTVPPYLGEWLKSNGSASGSVRTLVGGAIAPQKEART
jgi:hypothetical protein